MQEKAANELMCIQSYRLQFVAGFIIPPAKRHLAVMHFDQSIVGYCYTMGIPALVIENLIRTTEEGLGIYHPLGVTASPDECLILLRIVQIPKRPVKLQLTA